MQLEEGEIVDEETFIEYLPLSRPDPSSAQQPSPTPISYTSDSSENDSDCLVKVPKRPKVALPDKYNVWVMNEYQEDLALSMNRCGMDNIDTSRAVESYPYKLASTSGVYTFHSPSHSSFGSDLSINRNHDEDFEKEKREDVTSIFQRKRIYKKRRKQRPFFDSHANGEPINLNTLAVTEHDSLEEVAAEIANQLNESNKDIISRAVAVLGKDKAIEYYEKTKIVEGNGGLLIYDRSRRRTSGGVYIFLIRQDRSIPSHQLREIFHDLQMRVSNQDVVVSKRKHKRRKKPHKPDVNKQGEVDLENQELENPPPSPATDGDLIPCILKGACVHIEDSMDTV